MSWALVAPAGVYYRIFRGPSVSRYFSGLVNKHTPMTYATPILLDKNVIDDVLYIVYLININTQLRRANLFRGGGIVESMVYTIPLTVSLHRGLHLGSRVPRTLAVSKRQFLFCTRPFVCLVLSIQTITL